MSRKKKEEAPASTAIATVEPQGQLSVTVAPSIEKTVERLETVRKFITKALNTGLQRAEAKALKAKKPLTEKERKALEIDYGTIPGVNKKFLLQPGAEKILMWLHVRPVYETSAVEMEKGHLEVVSRCRLLSVQTNEEIFQGPTASCSSMESNFRYRWVEMAPQPSKEWQFGEGKTLKALGSHKSMPEWKNGQKTGNWLWFEKHDNPNIYDDRNKVRQMAEKRALVKAVRNFGAMSEIFTEDPSEWAFSEDEAPETPEAPPTGQVVPSQSTTNGQKTIEVVWPSESSEMAYLRGRPGPAEIAGMVDFIEPLGTWLPDKGMWSIPAAHIPDLHEVATKRGYTVKEVSGLPSPKPEAAKGERQEPPSLVVPPSGLVSTVRLKEPKGKNPHMEVNYAGLWMYCFDAKLFEHLSKAANKDCALLTERASSGPLKIIGIKRIGTQEFEEGYLPVIDKNDARQRTLL